MFDCTTLTIKINQLFLSPPSSSKHRYYNLESDRSSYLLYLQAFNQRYLVGMGAQAQGSNQPTQNAVVHGPTTSTSSSSSDQPDTPAAHSVIQQPDDGLGNLPKGWGECVINLFL